MIKLRAFLLGIATLPMLMLPTNAKAQDNFKPGFIITNKLDTLYGEVDIKASSFGECHFKKTSNTELKVYKPGEIHSYRIQDGRYYISMAVPLRNSNVIVQDIAFSIKEPNGTISNVRYKDSTTTTKTLFVEYLLNGIVKLYYVKDNHQDYYFVLTPNNQLMELRKDQIETFHNGNLYAVNERSSYKGLLAFIMAEDPSLRKAIDRMLLEHRSLIDLGKKYHDFACKDGKCIAYQKEVAPLTLDYGLHVGFQNSLTNVSNIPKGYDFSAIPTLRVGVEIVANNMILDNEKVKFKCAVSYWRSKFEDKHAPISQSPGGATLTYTFSNIAVELDGVLKLSATPQCWFMEAGPTLCFTFAPKSAVSAGKSFIEYDPASLKVGANAAFGYQFPVTRKGSGISLKLTHAQFTNYSTTSILVGYTIR